MKRVALLTILALGGTELQQNLAAQQITPQQVRRMLEQTLPRGPMFVPGQVIAKMKTGAALPAARLAAFGVEVVDRRLSGGEYIYRIPPPVLATLAATQAQARLLTL